MAVPYVSDTIASVGTKMVAAVFTDVAAQLDSGQAISPTGITSVLTTQLTGIVVTGALSGAATISGTKLVQVVTGSALTPQAKYWLTFSYGPTPPDTVGERMMAMQQINCDY